MPARVFDGASMRHIYKAFLTRRQVVGLIGMFACSLLTASLAVAEETDTTRYHVVDGDALAELMARGVPVVDLRTPQEWRQTGVIAGAVRITAFDDRGQFVETFPSAFAPVAGPDDEVALICWTGARSRAVATALTTQIGYATVYNAEGGMMAWLGEGRPVAACGNC